MKTVFIYTISFLVVVHLGAVSVIAQNKSPDTGVILKDKSGRTPEERVRFLLNVGRAYLAEEDLERAQNAFERALAIAPDKVETQFILGQVYITVKKYKEAEELLTGLIKQRPDDFRLWNNLAWLYATAEDPAYRNGEKAVRYAQEAMVLQPYDYHVWSTLAEAYYVLGKYEKANRAIQHMATLVTQYAKNITKKEIDEYNAQIRKCRRALETMKILKKQE